MMKTDFTKLTVERGVDVVGVVPPMQLILPDTSKVSYDGENYCVKFPETEHNDLTVVMSPELMVRLIETHKKVEWDKI